MYPSHSVTVEIKYAGEDEIIAFHHGHLCHSFCLLTKRASQKLMGRQVGSLQMTTPFQVNTPSSCHASKADPAAKKAASEPVLGPQQIQAFDQLCHLYRGSSRLVLLTELSWDQLQGRSLARRVALLLIASSGREIPAAAHSLTCDRGLRPIWGRGTGDQRQSWDNWGGSASLNGLAPLPPQLLSRGSDADFCAWGFSLPTIPQGGSLILPRSFCSINSPNRLILFCLLSKGMSHTSLQLLQKMQFDCWDFFLFP